MNRTHRTVWSHARQAYVAAPENAKSAGKTSTRKVLMAPALLSLAASVGTAAWAVDLPTGGQVVGGSGSISTAGSQMTIHQSTSKLAIDWQSFSIGQGKTVEFVQPSASSVVLNRVLGTDVSVIQGALKANGQVFLVNPNGVLFTPTAQVNVGGIVASTLNISTQDFLDGNYRFAGGSSNAIVNQGNITAHGDGTNGGTVALIAAKITNVGQINAERGKVLMGAGSKVRLDLGGPVKIEVEEGALDALIEQGGGVRADGGLVYLTAKAVGQLTTTVINHTGITEARTLATGEQGQIYLMGDMAIGRTQVGGTLDASAPHGGDGGFVETSAAKVSFADDVKITTAAPMGKTGQWLIDPFDFTVASTGGDITGAALSSLLANNSITIQTADSPTAGGASGTNGDIFVNDGVTWSSGNTLKLSAYRSIEINAPINASAGLGGRLVLEYGQTDSFGIAFNNSNYLINAPVSLQASGAADGINNSPTNLTITYGAEKFGADDSWFFRLLPAGGTTHYTVINAGSDADNVVALQAMNPTGSYALSASLALTAPAPAGSNWAPIGSSATPFEGRLEGLGHTITGLNIHSPGNDGVGLFGHTHNAVLSNLTLANPVIHGGNRVGALVGKATFTKVGQEDGFRSISNVTASGSTLVQGTGAVGGLIGYLDGGKLQDSGSTVNVTGTGAAVGGLVGQVANGALVERTYAAGAVSGDRQVGGLVGLSTESTIQVSYASGAVSGISDNIGGLVGEAGLDENDWRSRIESVYATGSAAGGTRVGGLVGRLNGGSIQKAYATGNVSGDEAGGLVGSNGTNNSRSISEGYWDIETSGQTTSAGGDGKTTAQLKRHMTYEGWGLGNPDWTFPQAARGSAVAGYEYGLARPYLTKVTRVADRDPVTPTLLFNGGWGGQTADLQPGADGSAYAIGSWQQLQDIGLVLSSYGTFLSGRVNYYYYALTQNLDRNSAGYEAFAGASANNGAGWRAIAGEDNEFTGEFDGKGHTITGLTLRDSTPNETFARWPSLFGQSSDASFKNLHLTELDIRITESTNPKIGALSGSARGIQATNISADVTIKARTGEVGGLFGYIGTELGRSLISDSSVTFTIAKPREDLDIQCSSCGGLVGLATSVDIIRSTAQGSINLRGTQGSGGLVGLALDSTISHSSATVSITVEDSSGSMGGLVGNAARINIADSSANADINAAQSRSLGGLVGSMQGGEIIRSKASGQVIGREKVGGLIGTASRGSLAYSSSTVNVTASRASAGGLIGHAYDDTHITHSEALGNVTGQASVGGLVGSASGEVEPWDTDTRRNGVTVINSLSRGHLISTGAVGGVSAAVGGLVGYLDGINSFTNSYATGSMTVTGDTEGAAIGGLIGKAGSKYVLDRVEFWQGQWYGSVVKTDTSIDLINSFWDTDTTTQQHAIGAVDVQSNASGPAEQFNGTSELRLNGDLLTSGTNRNVSGATGLKTADMTKFATFDDAGWDIVEDSAYRGPILYPRLSMAANKPVWLIKAPGLSPDISPDIPPVTYINYALTDLGGNGSFVYFGDAYQLGNLWDNPTNIFGSSSYDTWKLGQDYQFIYNSAPVTGFTNAGTYSGISVAVLKNGYEIKNTGNTLGSFTITPKTLTVTGLTANDKVYDGTTAATIRNWGTVSTGIAGQTLVLNTPTTANFNDKKAGPAQTVTASGYSLANGTDGSQASNYRLSSTSATTTADISKAKLTLTGVTANSKTYDGTTAATLGGSASIAALSGDKVELDGTAQANFADKNAGTGKAVTITGLSLTGDDAGNYTLVLPADLVADISKAKLTLTGVTANSKTYDGTTTATLGGSASIAALSGDKVNLSGTAQANFADKNAGTGKAVTITGLSLTGDDAGNYTLVLPADLVASINPVVLGALQTDFAGSNVQGFGVSSHRGNGMTSPVTRLNRASTASREDELSMNGSLVFVYDDVNQTGATSQASGVVSAQSAGAGDGPEGGATAGRDPLGFMRVFVVRGGLNVDLSQKGGN